MVNAAKGRTATNAVWLQDIWTLLPDLKAVGGPRYEDWRAYDGINFSASPPLNVSQPRISASTFSPKAILAWQISDHWTLTGSWGIAYRMPTVTELYQAITTGTMLTVPNPNLKPERANTYELAAEQRTGNSGVCACRCSRKTSPMRCCRSRRRCCRVRPPCSALCRMWTAPGCAASNWWSTSMTSSFPAWN